jgi:hypothetical protein
MCDGKTQLLFDNELDHYLLNSSVMDQFKYTNDGPLTLYIQKDTPGVELESNLLPAPDGVFYTVLRLYDLEESIINGTWTKLPLMKTN